MVSENKHFQLHYGDITDFSSINNLINSIKPDEIYNLAAQSHVAVSFQMPDYTANTNAIGCLRILEIIRSSKIKKKLNFIKLEHPKCSVKSPKNNKLKKHLFIQEVHMEFQNFFAHWITINYRESYKIFACNGILFNHESPRRGETFVTRKITIGLSKIKLGLQKVLVLGNLDAKRDWGHARDYVEAQWLILQQKKPDDYVIATGKNYSVKDFINLCARILKINLKWKGKGISTKAYDQRGNCIIRCHKRYFRPAEVDQLLGNALKAKKN